MVAHDEIFEGMCDHRASESGVGGRDCRVAQEDTDPGPVLSRNPPPSALAALRTRGSHRRIAAVMRAVLFGLCLVVSLAMGPAAQPVCAASDALHPPLSQIPGLVASFAEYRPDHFHAGVDFSTSGRIGLPIHAVAAGAIYRLKVEWRGYGRALYLRHRDGRISVYGHLQSFEDRVLGLERRVQTEKRLRGVRYPGDIFLDPPVPVKRGAVVGYSGESGAGLPHLHFEIRRNEQEPTDPLQADWVGGSQSTSPVFEAAVLRADGPGSLIDGERVVELALTRGRDGVYAPSRTLVVSGPFLPEARIALEDGKGHRLGIRSLLVRVDSIPCYRLRLDRFRFADYPKVGLVLDHALSGMSPPRYTYFLSRLPGNDLGVGGEGEEDTCPPRHPPGLHRMEVEAAGSVGATARISIPFRVVPPVSLAWEEPGAGSALRRLRLGLPRSALGRGLRVAYTLLGEGDSLTCSDRKELADGEECRFDLSASARGITATVLMEGITQGRATLFLRRDLPAKPEIPRVRVDPFRGFVDVHLEVPPGGAEPARLLLRSAGSVSRWELREEAPGKLLATVPAQAWAAAESVGLQWEALTPRSVDLPLIPRHAEPDKPVEIEVEGVRVSLPAGAVYAPTPLHVERAGTVPLMGEGMGQVSAPLRLLPDGLPLARKALLRFPLPSSEPHPERSAVYRLDGARGDWIYLGGEVRDQSISVAVGRFDTYALLRDESPPRLLGIEPSDPGLPAPARPVFKVRVEDRGSGLNYDGVHLVLDGEEIETEFDPDRGWSLATPTSPLSVGSHSGKVWAVDRSGNRSTTEAFTVTVR